ncbi:MAG: NAD(P)-dependent oxidoreductase [bacterium]|nr:NAD(P)-dependent oxidoreductase [bacterium]
MLKVLVSGASGFLGRRVVRAFVEQGIEVRALVRPGHSIEALGWPAAVEIFSADLLESADLEHAFSQIDVLVHLAGGAAATEEAQFAANVTATERLLEAMKTSTTRKLVHCSSFAVYDYQAALGVLDEDTPLDETMAERDAYAIAKIEQERLVRRKASENAWELCVLRPGFVWGEGRADLAGIGARVGSWLVVFGDRDRRMPLTHVDNCASCFVLAATDARAMGHIFNVVDDEGASAWGYAEEYQRRSGSEATCVRVPYAFAFAVVRAIGVLGSALARGARFPGLLVPRRFEARFKPLRFSNRKIRRALDWEPPFDYITCLDRTFPSPDADASLPRGSEAD